MVKKITLEELRALMGSEKAFQLVDVLSRTSYEQEHIEGAISVPVEEIGKVAEQVFKKGDKIIVYCASFDCAASTHAAEKLVSLGFTDVWDYKGGLKEYKEAGFPLVGVLHKDRGGGCAACGSPYTGTGCAC